MYKVFKGQSSSAPSSSVTLTLALTYIQANVEGGMKPTLLLKILHLILRERLMPLTMQTSKKSLKNLSTQQMLTLSLLVHPHLNLQSFRHNESPNPEPIIHKEKENVLPLMSMLRIKETKEEARLHTINKPKVIKVVREEAKKLGIHPKEVIIAKTGKKFKKAQDAKHEVLKKKHTEKVIKSLELRKHKYDNYIISELDELRKIILRKKITVVKHMIKSLSRRYERIKKIPEELGIPPALPAPIPEQDSSKTSRRKRKHMELEPEIKIHGLECDRTLPKNVPFVNNMVIKEPKNSLLNIMIKKSSSQRKSSWKLLDMRWTE
nr:hypothetical protein [Tanacetum cinerariifolium]